MTFEEQLKKIEELAEDLESDTIPLDEMIQKYEEGINIIKEAQEFLNKAELKIINISEKNTD